MSLVMGFHNSSVNNFEIEISGKVTGGDDGLGIPRANITIKGTNEGVAADLEGNYTIKVPNEKATLVFSFIGYVTQEIKVGGQRNINVIMQPEYADLEEVVVVGYATRNKRKARKAERAMEQQLMSAPSPQQGQVMRPHSNLTDFFKSTNESYAEIEENTFLSPWKNPYSTFSIDVDAASYSNVRRYINDGQLPPKDAVKIEELINYFDYEYNGPRGKHPFAVTTEVAAAPWNPKHQLVHIGLQGKKVETDNLPASNLVFLLDVSGSMNAQNKLPLLKKSFKLLVNQLRPEDRVAIVVYAGAAGEVLPSTSGSDKKAILKAINRLSAGGSTAGGAGIQLAYKIAKDNFIAGGNNRIILATDGDFNVGASSDKAMEDLIEEKRKEGVFLTVLGFGTGNYKDSKMETLADKGNGNHAYIDNILEAKKVLVNEFGGTLFTIAKDVKIQVEFNPANVQAYRLIGYENRRLNDEDFNNDKKDAGELGAGHSVTALYEVIPMGVESEFKPLDDLKYQDRDKPKATGNSSDLLTVKLRYKQPDGDKSTLLEEVVSNKNLPRNRVSNNYQWSSVVASFGMLLRDSDHKGGLNYTDLIEKARAAKGEDRNGYRAEFIKLLEMSELLAED